MNPEKLGILTEGSTPAQSTTERRYVANSIVAVVSVWYTGYNTIDNLARVEKYFNFRNKTINSSYGESMVEDKYEISKF